MKKTILTALFVVGTIAAGTAAFQVAKNPPMTRIEQQNIKALTCRDDVPEVPCWPGDGKCVVDFIKPDGKTIQYQLDGYSDVKPDEPAQ